MDIAEAASLLKLFANESRLRILGLVADRERSVGELSEILGLKEPTVSHHLSRLSSAGVVVVRPEGTTRYYGLDAEALTALTRDLLPSAGEAPREGVQADADRWERRILGTYLVDGRLTRIPATRKKRDVLLRWLVERFDAEQRYPEAEVNEIIARHHSDYATLRRELIGAGLMARADSVYWRVGGSSAGGNASVA